MNGPYRPLQSLDGPLRAIGWVILLATLAVLAFILWPLSLLAAPIVIWQVTKKIQRIRAMPAARAHAHRAEIARIWR